MCYNCGCQMSDDDMGHHDNITNHTIEHFAKDQGEEVDVVRAKMMESLQKGEIPVGWEEMFDKAAKASNQSLEEAKKNTLDLLKMTSH